MVETFDNRDPRTRSEAVRRYFTRTPGRPSNVVAITLAVIAAFCAIPAALTLLGTISEKDEAQACFGCLTILSGLAVLTFAGPAWFFYTVAKHKYERDFRNAEPKPSDQQIDAWHSGDTARLRTHALNQLDLIAEQVATDNPNGPLVVVGSGPSPQVRTGNDGIVRFSSHEILIIYLTTYHLAAYKCVVDLHDGSIRTETTQEYHYDDVVSVSTQTDNSPLTWYVEGQARQSPTHQRFAVSVASGEQISVAIGFTPSSELAPNSTFRETGANGAIRSIRARLREKKGGSTDTSDRDPLI